MTYQIEIGGFEILVSRKSIKNVHLSVYPPIGSVAISIPDHMNDQQVRAYISTKIPWIRKQQRKLAQQERETERTFVSGESHFIWGKRYLLKVVDGKKEIYVKGNKIVLVCPHGSSLRYKKQMYAAWQRNLIRSHIDSVLVECEKKLGVHVKNIHIRSMRTKWGSCTQNKSLITLNTELVKKPKDCFEYVLIHELLHLKYPNHKREFQNAMTSVIPNWKNLKTHLNDLAL